MAVKRPWVVWSPHHERHGIEPCDKGVCGGLPCTYEACMRDVKKSTPARTSFGLPACKPPGGLTNDSEVSSCGNRRISAMCGWWCWAS